MVEESNVKTAPETVPSVREMFSVPEKGAAEPPSEGWKSFQKRINEEVKGIKWTAAMPDLAPKIGELLDIKIPDVLVTAWKKVSELQTLLEKSKNNPQQISYLELAEHTINSEHKPSIDLKLRSKTVKKIVLNIQLSFKLKGFVVKIQEGMIKEMQTGQCEMKGAIKYAGLPIAEKKLEPIKLPLKIPIRREADRVEDAKPPGIE